MHKHFLNRQFLVYLVGGVLSALTDVGILKMMLISGTPVVLAASAGFVCGLLVNYAFHARVTFAQLANRSSFLRYLCVVGANYLVTIALVAAGQHLLGSPVAGKLLSLPLVALNGYLLGKFWIFKQT